MWHLTSAAQQLCHNPYFTLSLIFSVAGPAITASPVPAIFFSLRTVVINLRECGFLLSGWNKDHWESIMWRPACVRQRRWTSWSFIIQCSVWTSKYMVKDYYNILIISLMRASDREGQILQSAVGLSGFFFSPKASRSEMYQTVIICSHIRAETLCAVLCGQVCVETFIFRPAMKEWNLAKWTFWYTEEEEIVHWLTCSRTAERNKQTDSGTFEV